MTPCAGQEFHPYVFQIFAQLLELRQPPLPPMYVQMFPPLLSPTFWERPGNIPALVRLLQAYLAKGGEAIVQNGRLVVRCPAGIAVSVVFRSVQPVIAAVKIEDAQTLPAGFASHLDEAECA